MDGEKRVIDLRGTWRVKKNKLVLIAREKTVLEGGKLVESTGSTASKYEIIDGKLKKIKLKTPQKIIYTITPILQEKIGENYFLPMIRINNKKFWRLYDDPASN